MLEIVGAQPTQRIHDSSLPAIFGAIPTSDPPEALGNRRSKTLIKCRSPSCSQPTNVEALSTLITNQNQYQM